MTATATAAPTKTSSNPDRPLVREYSELEGTLLPTAHLVSPVEDNNGSRDSSFPEQQQPDHTIELMATVLSADSVSLSPPPPPPRRDQPYASAIPLGDDDAAGGCYYYNPHHGTTTTTSSPLTTTTTTTKEEEQLQLGETRGRCLNEMEQEDVRRNAREIRAIQYHQAQHLQQANQRARQVQGQEDAGFVQTTIAMEYNNNDQTIAKHPISANTTGHNDVEYQGTFGRQYEVSDYTVSEYDTQEYDVTEYKSLYDS
ncbi:hypothetical protein ACA910_018812 [Epithemia clementina (nom. ined.)]